MADPATAATEELLKLGVPGIVIIGLCLFIYRLLSKQDARDTAYEARLKEKDAAIAALQEARLTEAKLNIEVTVKATGALVRSADAQDQLVEQFRSIATDYQIRRGRT